MASEAGAPIFERLHRGLRPIRFSPTHAHRDPMNSILRRQSRLLLVARPARAALVPLRFTHAFPHRLASTSSSVRAPASSGASSAQLYKEAYDRARAEHHSQRNTSLLLYSVATVILVGAASYLAVPLYRVFCSATGYGGTPITDVRFSSDRLVPMTETNKRIRVQFNADSSDNLPWSFSPQQKEVNVLPGETALAFYTATNHSEEDIIGIATYNVTPNNVRRPLPLPRE